MRALLALIVAALLQRDCTSVPADHDGRAAAAGTPHRVLVSGHSLTDAPYPAYLAAIMASAGGSARVDARNMSGSSIAMRINDGALLTELEQGAASGRPYDTLIITEQHTLLGNIVWSDSIRNLRRAHDTLIAGARGGRTFLFTSWLDIGNRDDPSRWRAIEAAAVPLWQCVALRINASLSIEGRADRIDIIPAAGALAWLVGRATEGAGIPGLSGHTTRETVDRLFIDDVHPTALGSWFVALVTEAYIYRRAPRGPWVPDGVSEALAQELRGLAWEFASRHGDGPPMTLEQCRDYVSRAFAPLYLAYQRDTRWRGNGALAAYVKWARHRIEWPVLFRRHDPGNPFHFDPAHDRSYWQKE